MAIIKGKFGHKTDIGLVRPSNEDKAYACIDAQSCVLLSVCDGMGGYMKGDRASKLATDILQQSFLSKIRFMSTIQIEWWISKTVKKINTAVYEESQRNEKVKGMGTTLCFAIFYKNKIFVVNIGDSRCYRVDEEQITQLTRDQTYVEYLVSVGDISEQEKLTSKDRHALMNFVGKEKNINYSLNIWPNEKKTILLCSDGLYNNASNQQIFSGIASKERLDQKINTLIGIAKANGGTDNIAISVWEPYDHD